MAEGELEIAREILLGVCFITSFILFVIACTKSIIIDAESNLNFKYTPVAVYFGDFYYHWYLLLVYTLLQFYLTVADVSTLLNSSQSFIFAQTKWNELSLIRIFFSFCFFSFLCVLSFILLTITKETLEPLMDIECFWGFSFGKQSNAF